MCGIPGSGKSTMAKELRVKYASTIIEPDAFRLELTGQTYYYPIENHVWAIVKTTLNVLLRMEHDVILDATSLTVDRRKEWVKLAKKFDVPSIVYTMLTPQSTCIIRNSSRVFPVPDDVMRKQMDTFTVPSIREGFSSVLMYGTKEGSFDYHLQGCATDDGTISGNYEEVEWTKLYS
jgi:predicted kinase